MVQQNHMSLPSGRQDIFSFTGLQQNLLTGTSNENSTFKCMHCPVVLKIGYLYKSSKGINSAPGESNY